MGVIPDEVSRTVWAQPVPSLVFPFFSFSSSLMASMKLVDGFSRIISWWAMMRSMIFFSFDLITLYMLRVSWSWVWQPLSPF